MLINYDKTIVFENLIISPTKESNVTRLF